MGLLRSPAFLLLALVGCYAPELEDCAVTCTSDNECGTGQTCGDLGLCARPGVSCGAVSGDAAPTVTDATPDPDGEPPIDAPPTGMLRIKIGDQGRVDVSGIGACDSAISNQCDFVVGLGVPRTLVASPHNNRYFETWAKACSASGSNTTCVLTPTAPLTEAEAKFRKDDD